MNIDTLRAKAEAAKAWRPRVMAPDSDGAVMLTEEVRGAQRAVEDIARRVDHASSGDALIGWWVRVEHANSAARIASYFCSEPNPVSEFRDAVKEECK